MLSLGSKLFSTDKGLKYLFYAFTFMYFIKNSGYFLTNEQQQIVRRIHRKKYINSKIIEEFCYFYDFEDYFKIDLIKAIQKFNN
jgi:hypothetical protein